MILSFWKDISISPQAALKESSEFISEITLTNCLNDFTCPACYNKILLGTDGGRYGNIGDFSCIHCGEIYHATDDDAPSPNNLYVWSDKYGKTTLKEIKKWHRLKDLIIYSNIW